MFFENKWDERKTTYVWIRTMYDLCRDNSYLIMSLIFLFVKEIVRIMCYRVCNKKLKQKLLIIHYKCVFDYWYFIMTIFIQLISSSKHKNIVISGYINFKKLTIIGKRKSISQFHQTAITYLLSTLYYTILFYTNFTIFEMTSRE